MNLKKTLGELEAHAVLRHAKREKERLESRSQEEFLFFLAHFCYPEEVNPPEEPRIRQCTHNGIRMTITLERAK